MYSEWKVRGSKKKKFLIPELLKKALPLSFFKQQLSKSSFKDVSKWKELKTSIRDDSSSFR